jgi:hypothetical protein
MTNWLDSEVEEIKTEIRMTQNCQNKRRQLKKKEFAVMLKFLALVVVFFCAACHPLEARKAMQMPPKKRLMPDVWICKKCGYDNFVGITHCSVCGHPKKGR